MKSLKQLYYQRELCSGLDLTFLNEYVLLILKVSSQILEKFLVGSILGLLLLLIYVYDMCTNGTKGYKQNKWEIKISV